VLLGLWMLRLPPQYPCGSARVPPESSDLIVLCIRVRDSAQAIRFHGMTLLPTTSQLHVASTVEETTDWPVNRIKWPTGLDAVERVGNRRSPGEREVSHRYKRVANTAVSIMKHPATGYLLQRLLCFPLPCEPLLLVSAVLLWRL